MKIQFFLLFDQANNKEHPPRRAAFSRVPVRLLEGHMQSLKLIQKILFSENIENSENNYIFVPES